MVDADSTTMEVLQENPVAATDEDIEQWALLDNGADFETAITATDDYYWYTSVGLFWNDLTDFFTDCATADDCSDDYETDYSEGCAIGWYMVTDYPSYSALYGALGSTYNYLFWCLQYTYECVGFTVYYDGTGTYAYLLSGYYDYDDPFDTDYPADATDLDYYKYATLYAGGYGYGFSENIAMMWDWSFTSDDLPGGDMYHWRFQDVSGDYYLAIGDETVAWAVMTEDAAANVDTDVTMAGAASLAVATTAVAAVLATM
jgi:hypothetical protein